MMTVRGTDKGVRSSSLGIPIWTAAVFVDEALPLYVERDGLCMYSMMDGYPGVGRVNGE